MKKRKPISSLARYWWRCLHDREWLRHIFIAPFGRLRKPAEVKWKEGHNGMLYPICPHCHNLPYDVDCCYFCGQRFSNKAYVIDIPKGPLNFTFVYQENDEEEQHGYS